MSLRIIEPERPGFDSRTFECPKCFITDTLVVSISDEVEVPIAGIGRNPAAPIAVTASRFSRPVDQV